MAFTEQANHRTAGGASASVPWWERPDYQESLTLLRLRTVTVCAAAGTHGDTYLKQAKRFGMCGQAVTLKEWAHNETGEVTRTWGGGWSCRQRLCPMCQHNRGRVCAAQLSAVHGAYTATEAGQGSVALLLTLTVRNCEPDALAGTLRAMHHAFGKLRRRAEWEASVQGFFRSTEVTVNRQGSRTYHPHIHVLLMVPRAYLRRGSGLFITHDQWCAMWQDCLGVDYRPIVGISAVTPEAMAGRKGRKGADFSLSKAIREVAKYCVKPDGFQERLPGGRYWTDPAVFAELQEGMRGHRLTAWGGVFSDIRAELGLKDVESADTDLSAELEALETPRQNHTLLAHVSLEWRAETEFSRGEYVEVSRRDARTGETIINRQRFRGGG